MNDSPGTLQRLSNRIDEMELRIDALERRVEVRPASTLLTVPPAVRSSVDGKSHLENINFFPIAGRAMLGIAGAYVLRAIAAAGVIPKLPVSILAVAYAFGWLICSSRAAHREARAAYSATAALILAPMLWENTLQFHVFKPLASAGLLSAFMILAAALDLLDHDFRMLWIAQSLAAITGVVLAFATQQIMPFLIALLVAALITEYARCKRHAQPVWPLIMLSTDAVTWGLIFVYSGPQNARVDHPSLNAIQLVAPAVILFVINGTGVAVRTLYHQNRITASEVIQTIVAFLLSASAVLYFTSQQALAVFGVFCTILSVGMYFASLGYLRHRQDRRNFRVYATCAALLLPPASLWLLSPPGSAILLSVAALAAAWLSLNIEREILTMQVALFLLTATAIAGLPGYVFDVIAGSIPSRPDAAAIVVCVCACLAFLLQKRLKNDNLRQEVFLFIPALLATSGLIALMVQGALRSASLVVVLDVHHVAFLRTLTICIALSGLAFGGARWDRVELTRLAYIALAFVAAKLVFEDLRHGHMEFIAASIALFAVSLLIVPRLIRLGAQLHAAAASEAMVHSSR